MRSINSMLITEKTLMSRVDGITAALVEAPKEVFDEACRRMWKQAAEYVDSLPDKNPLHLMTIAEFLVRVNNERFIKAQVAKIAQVAA